MAAPRRTQKQIAERYKANLGYYKKKHPWRRARFLVSCLAIVGGIIGIVFFQMRGGETFFNPGKISSSHARFANDCAQCHDKSLISAGPLTLVASSKCLSCHGNSEVMQASAQKGMQLPSEAFKRHPHLPQQVALELPRPSRGYTQRFSSFWNGHPEFQLEREQVRDPDML